MCAFVDRQRHCWIDTLIELLKICIDFALRDGCELVYDVFVQRMDVYLVEPLVGVVELRNDEVLKCCRADITSYSPPTSPIVYIRIYYNYRYLAFEHVNQV